MNIKNILQDTEFIKLMKHVSNINVTYIKKNEHNGETYFDFKNKDFFQEQKNCYQEYLNSFNSFLNLYSSYTSEFGTPLEFAENLFSMLKEYVVVKNVLPSNNIDKKRVLTQDEIAFYEAKRDEYIKLLLNFGKHHQYYTGLISTLMVLRKSKAEEIANTFDKIERDYLEKYNIEKSLYVDAIDQDNNERVKNPQNVTQRKFDEENFRKNYFIDMLPLYFISQYKSGNDIVTKKISINKDRFSGIDIKFKDTPEYLKVLAFLENYILAEQKGLICKGIAFDGFRFFHIKSGQTVNYSSNWELGKTNLTGTDRFSQSNFVLNEDFASALLSIKKKSLKICNKNFIKSTDIVDGETIITTKQMYRRTDNSLAGLNSRDLYGELIDFGAFCKVKEFNKTRGTYSYYLFYLPNNDNENAIQLFRIDKVPDMFKGVVASHNLRGKEKIETNLHAHTYNLIDAVLKNIHRLDNLGKMDLSHIFPISEGLSRGMVEEIFDKFCGIHNPHLKKVNQNYFAKKFKLKKNNEKYPVELVKGNNQKYNEYSK